MLLSFWCVEIAWNTNWEAMAWCDDSAWLACVSKVGAARLVTCCSFSIPWRGWSSHGMLFLICPCDHCVKDACFRFFLLGLLVNVLLFECEIKVWSFEQNAEYAEVQSSWKDFSKSGSWPSLLWQPWQISVLKLNLSEQSSSGKIAILYYWSGFCLESGSWFLSIILVILLFCCLCLSDFYVHLNFRWQIATQRDESKMLWLFFLKQES